MPYTIEFPTEEPELGQYARTREAQGRYSIELPEAQPRTASESLARGTGLGMRSVVGGALAIPNMVVDGLNTLLNYGVRGVNSAAGTSIPELGMPSQASQRLMTRAGLPEPETTGERVASEVLGAATGAGGLAKTFASQASRIDPGVAQRVLEALSRGPGMQTVGAASGAAAGGVTREAGGSEGAQLAASLLGALAPTATQAVGSSAVRGIVRGGEAGRQNYADRLETFRDAGTTPSVGQASGSRVAQQAESGLANVSSSAGVMDRAAAREAQEMGAHIERIANDYLPNANSTKAGLTIEKGIRSFVDRFRAEEEFLFEKLDKHLPPGTPVDVSSTRAALGQLNADIPGAPNLSALFKNTKIRGIEEALTADTASAPLPYEALKTLRTQVGRELTDHNLVSDAPRSQLKALYAALSDDMSAAAQQAGPQAEKAFNRANAYTRAGHDRIESVLERVGGKDTAERIFQAAANPSEMREGGTTIRTVMKSLAPDERKAVTAAVVRRMGIASPGSQNELGEVFSSQTYLTNWNKVSPEAKAVLFPDQELRESLDQVAKASAMIRQGSKVFANPSGTTPALNNQLTGFSLAGSAITGHLGVTASIAALLAGANASARLMTNPRFVKWLAKTTEMPPSMLPTQVQMLSRYAEKNWPEEDRAELDRYLSQVRDSYLSGQGELR